MSTDLVPACHRCHSTANLRRKGKHWACAVCSPVRCRVCHGIAPAVAFGSGSGQRCLSCIRFPPAAPRKRARGGPLPGYSAAHLRWIRSWPCAVNDATCSGLIQAHHVRHVGGGAGTGLRPPDRCAVPLCVIHHRIGHSMGWASFEAHYRVDLTAMAETLARLSPALGIDRLRVGAG